MATQQYFKYSFVVTGGGGAYTLGLKFSGPDRGYIVTETDDGGGDDQTQLGDIAGDDYDLIDSDGSGPNYKGVFVSTSPDGTGFVGQYNGLQGGPDNPGDRVFYTNDPSYATGQTVTGFSSTPFVIACYVTGTLIRTVSGDVAVEALAIGDRVVTASGAPRPIKWIGRRSYAGRFAAANPDVLPITFRVGSLGESMPSRDLSVSPKHAMLLDSALIAAELLVNGVSVVRAESVDEVTYWHVELDSHDVLLAENAPSESFVDDDSRAMFHNAAEFAALYPEDAAIEAAYCAPRVTDGYRLDAIRRRIDGLAGLPTAGDDDFGDLLGAVDSFDGVTLVGWARNAAHPDAPVCLDIVVDGALAGRVLAGGSGAGPRGHGFAWPLPQVFSGVGVERIEVRRTADGAPLASAARWLAAAA